MSKQKIIIGIIIILAILTIAFLLPRSPQPTEEIPLLEPEITEPEASRKPPAPLPTGKQAYDIMTDSSQRFKIIEAEVDPLDVKKGENQQVRVLVKDLDDKPITAENKVSGIAYTDNKTTAFDFEMREVSDDNGSTITEWDGFWTLDDTYDRRYMVSITAKADGREHKIDLTFR